MKFTHYLGDVDAENRERRSPTGDRRRPRGGRRDYDLLHTVSCARCGTQNVRGLVSVGSLKFGNSRQGLLSQSSGIPCDSDLASTLDVRYATVNCRNELS